MYGMYDGRDGRRRTVGQIPTYMRTHGTHAMFEKRVSCEKCVNCPVCGDVPQVKRNRFCSDCNKFGHSVMTDRCARRRKDLEAFLHEFGLALA